MSVPLLTVRNLSSTPLELKLLERSPPLPDSAVPPMSPPGSGGLKNVTHHFTKLMSSLTPPSTPQTPQFGDKDQTIQQEVSLRLEPVKISKTDIAPPVEPQHLRLHFDAEGEHHYVDTPCPSRQSTILTPLAPDPRFNFTAIYNPDFSHLTLFSSAKLNSWMQKLRDDIPLSALSIPGTHNSPTHHRALPSVRCQAVSPKEQLENGVRFFDIRVQPETPEDPTKDGLLLVHSVFPISVTGKKYFRDLANEVLAFLDRNPSEGVIMSIKREGTGNATDAQLSCILRDHYAGDVGRWFTAPRIPTLGEARHKIVLTRRFALDDRIKQEWDGAGWCINAETWADNTPNDTCPSGDVCVQDFYEVLETQNIEKKIQFAEEHLERAAACRCVLPPPGSLEAQSTEPPPKQPFFINFLSASNFWKANCWPEKIAAKLNPATVDFLCRKHNEDEKGDGSTGILVCDWVGKDGDWDLVRCVVGMNSELELKGRGL